MKDQIFQLKVNDKDFGKVQGKLNTTKEVFINYIKGLNPEFDATRDTLEIINVTPPEQHKMLRHSARDKSKNNAYVDAIISRHFANMVVTYGEARVLKLIADVHGLVKQETTAS